MSPGYDTWSDDDLVALAKRDHGGAEGRAAANALLSRYRDRAYLWSHRVVRDHDRALDLAQDALLSAYRGLPEFDARSRFSSWLFSIVRNRCLTALRPRMLSRDEGVDPDALFEEASDPAIRVGQRLEEADVLAAVRDHLDPLEQDALWLRAVEYVSVEDITRMLGLTNASGARGLLQSARRKLRAWLISREGSGE